MSDIEREAFERIERQFTSGNSVSVDRASVRKEDWEAAKKYAARQSPASGEVEPAEIVSDIRHSADVDSYTTSQRKFLWSIADRLEKTFAHPPAKVPEGMALIPLRNSPPHHRRSEQ